MPQAAEDRGGNWAGSVTLGFSQAQGGGAAGRQDGKMAGSAQKALRLLRLPPRLSFSLSQEPLSEDDVSGK